MTDSLKRTGSKPVVSIHQVENEAALGVTSSAILLARQNPRTDGHGRHLAELAQGRKQDHLKQTNPGNCIKQTDNTNPPAEIAAD